MKILIVLIIGILAGMAFDKYEILEKIEKEKSSQVDELKEYVDMFHQNNKDRFQEFKQSKDLNEYLNKVKEREPETSYLKKDGECYKVDVHERPFKLGTFKVTKKIKCSL